MGTPLTAPDRGRHRSRSHCRCTTVPDVPASPRGTSVAARLVQAVGRARQAPTFRRRRGRGGRSDSRTTMHGSKGPIAGVIRGPGVASIALPATAPEHRRRVGSAAWAPPRGLRRVGSAAWAPPRGLRRVGSAARAPDPRLREREHRGHGITPLARLPVTVSRMPRRYIVRHHRS
jgi:hypothetical protein